MVGHLVFNGYDFGELFFCHAPKKLMPEVGVTEQAVSGRDGSYFKSRSYKPMDIPCTMFLRAPKQGQERLIEILNEVASNLDVDQAKLYLPTDDTRYYMATVKGSSTVDEFVTSAKLTVTFRVFDPFRRGTKRTMELHTSTATYVQVGGNRPAKPIVTATPVADTTMYRWRDYANNKSVYVYRNLQDTSEKWLGTETIVLDTEKELCTVNGQVWPVTLTSDFFEISGRARVWANAPTTIEWEETWL